MSTPYDLGLRLRLITISNKIIDEQRGSEANKLPHGLKLAYRAYLTLPRGWRGDSDA